MAHSPNEESPMESLTQFLAETFRPWPGIFLADFGRYLAAAALVTTVIVVATSSMRRARLVRTRTPEAHQRRREFFNSLAAAAVFGTVGLSVYHGSMNGIFHVYRSVDDFGIGYWIFSLMAIVVVHDAYFYWTHRWMHRRSMFAWTHSTHHRSVAPTQWAAYSFAPTEAFIQAFFLPLYLLLVPTHVSVIAVWGIHQVVRNAFGHSGIEFEPRSWLAGWWGRWLTTTLHHDLHHAQGRHNFGLYFTWWDRWCGTEHPEYRARLQSLIDTIDAAALENQMEKA
jgi:Delta7-sterol 5-desaturase